MRGEYTFGSTVLRFRVEESARRRSVSIVVDPEDGILVKTPVDFGLAEAEAVVGTKAAWIVQRLADQREAAAGAPAREFVGGESHWMQGRQHRLRLVEQPGVRRAKARVEGTFIVIELPPKLTT